MSNKKVEKTGEFQATDAAGVAHTVVVFTTFVEYAPLSGGRSWIPGLKAYKTVSGQHLNVLEDGVFENIHTKQVLRKV